jgi:sugar lactone lactonase YvrE
MLVAVMVLGIAGGASPSLGQVPPFITAWGGFGPGDAQFLNPVAVAVDAAGVVYVGDDHANVVKRFTRSGIYLSQWPAFDPKGTAIGPDGSVYMTQGGFGAPVVGRFTPGGALVAQWRVGMQITGIAVDKDGSVYVADNLGPLRKFSATGTLLGQWGTEGTGPGQFKYLDGVAVDGMGHVYTAEIVNNRVQKFTTSGVYITQWGISGSGNGQFDEPVRLVTSPDGALVYVVDNQNSRVQVFTNSGSYLGQWGTAGGDFGQFRNPIGIAVDGFGNVFVADTNNGRMQVFGDAATPARPMTWGALKQRFR